jgi:hypothetical protein
LAGVELVVTGDDLVEAVALGMYFDDDEVLQEAEKALSSSVLVYSFPATIMRWRREEI